MSLLADLIEERENLLPKFVAWEGLEFSQTVHWDPTKLNVYRAMAKLLNFPHEYMAVLDARQAPELYQPALETMRQLNGPHGYAVYRMLLLKKNELQES